MIETDRAPFVGVGVGVGVGGDGARRSARIDRDEMDGLSWMGDRKDQLSSTPSAAIFSDCDRGVFGSAGDEAGD